MGNKGTIMTNSAGQGRMIRVEETEDGTGLEIGSLHLLVDDETSQNANEYALQEFQINEEGNLQLTTLTFWRARGTIAYDDATGGFGVKITWQNDTSAECGQLYSGTVCDDQGNRTPININSADPDTRFRFSFDTGNGTVDANTLNYADPDPNDTPFGSYSECP